MFNAKKILIVCGCRPNFMKIAPLCVGLKSAGIPYEVFFSGQHYNDEMFSIFKEDLGLDIGFFANTKMTGNSVKDIIAIMESFSNYLCRSPWIHPSAIIVVGDVNTTYACALVAKRIMSCSLIHLEAGLRSFDQRMPEEMNRMTVDHISDMLLCPSPDAVFNLSNEGIGEGVEFVGNIMIDCLTSYLPKIEQRDFPIEGISRPYVLVTMHRPENVDDSEILKRILVELNFCATEYDVIFPIHPRTADRIKNLGFVPAEGFHIVSPLGYLDFMRLMIDAECVVTDSGGVQEETTYLGIPCFTVRQNTERPITIDLGTNTLISYDQIKSNILADCRKTGTSIPFWDGKTTERIISVLTERGIV